LDEEVSGNLLAFLSYRFLYMKFRSCKQETLSPGHPLCGRGCDERLVCVTVGNYECGSVSLEGSKEHNKKAILTYVFECHHYCMKIQ